MNPQEITEIKQIDRTVIEFLILRPAVFGYPNAENGFCLYQVFSEMRPAFLTRPEQIQRKKCSAEFGLSDVIWTV